MEGPFVIEKIVDVNEYKVKVKGKLKRITSSS